MKKYFLLLLMTLNASPALALLCDSGPGVIMSIADPRILTQSLDSRAGTASITPYVVTPKVEHLISGTGSDIIQWYYPSSTEPNKNTCSVNQFGIINPQVAHYVMEGIVLRYGGTSNPRHYRISAVYPSLGPFGVTLRWATWNGHTKTAQIGALCNIPSVIRTGGASYIYARVSGQGDNTVMQAWVSQGTQFLGSDWKTWGPAHCTWTDNPGVNAVDTGSIVGISTEISPESEIFEGYMTYGTFHAGDALEQLPIPGIPIILN